MFLSSLDEVKNKTQGFEVGGNVTSQSHLILEVKAGSLAAEGQAYSDAVKERWPRKWRLRRRSTRHLPSMFRSPWRILDSMSVRLWAGAGCRGDLYEFCDDDGHLRCSGRCVWKECRALFMAVYHTMRATADTMHNLLISCGSQRRTGGANPRNMFVTLVCMIIDPRQQ
jgi:hypothetical protein